MSTTRKVARNFSWLFIGTVASGGLNFLTLVYIARVLGAAAFGLLQFAQALLLYLVLFVDSGLSTFGTREIARDHEAATAISINILVIRFLLATLLFTIAAFLVAFLPLDLKVRLLLLLTFLFVFYRALNIDWIFQGLEKMEYIAFSKTLFSGVSFLLIVWLVKNDGDLLKVPGIQFIVGGLVATGLLVLLFSRIIAFDLSRLRPASWWPALLTALPLGASVLMMQIYDNMDTLMLGVMAQPSVVGYYNAAYRIFYVLAGILSLWVAVIFPVASYRLSVQLGKAQELLEKSLRLTLLFALPAAVLVFFLAPLIIELVFGSAYSAAVPALRLLVWALIPMVIASTCGGLILVPGGAFRQFFWANIAAALVNVLLNFLLIPHYSFLGAAVATLIAQLFVAVVAYYFSRQILKLKLIRSLVNPLLIAFLFAVLYLLTSSLIVSSAFMLALIFALEGKFLFSFVREILGDE